MTRKPLRNSGVWESLAAPQYSHWNLPAALVKLPEYEHLRYHYVKRSIRRASGVSDKADSLVGCQMIEVLFYFDFRNCSTFFHRKGHIKSGLRPSHAHNPSHQASENRFFGFHFHSILGWLDWSCHLLAAFRWWWKQLAWLAARPDAQVFSEATAWMV